MNKRLWTLALLGLVGASTAGRVVVAASRPVVPARAEIQRIMRSYREVGVSHETYRPEWKTVTRSYKHGIVHTAIVGRRWPTADGMGQVMFFFDGKRFVGLNSPHEVFAVSKIRALPDGGFAVTYANYRPTDAMVDPTLPPYTVDYWVTSHGVAASRSLAATVQDRQTAQRETAGLPSRAEILRMARVNITRSGQPARRSNRSSIPWPRRRMLG